MTFCASDRAEHGEREQALDRLSSGQVLKEACPYMLCLYAVLVSVSYLYHGPGSAGPVRTGWARPIHVRRQRAGDTDLGVRGCRPLEGFSDQARWSGSSTARGITVVEQSGARRVAQGQGWLVACRAESLSDSVDAPCCKLTSIVAISPHGISEK